MDGKVFSANVLNCREKALSTGESIRVGDRASRYEGDDGLGNSIFIALEPFPEFETVEQSYKELFVVLEVYPMKNGHFCVRPYVQSGETGHDYTRGVFRSLGSLNSRSCGSGGLRGRTKGNWGSLFVNEADHDQEQ